MKILCSTTSTKDENEDEDEDKNVDRKSTVERRKLIFKTNALVPKTTVLKKQRAPLSRRHLPSLNTAGRFVFVLQAGPAAFSMEALLYRKGP